MTSEQDRKDIYQTIIILCFDLRGGISVLSSCSTILNKIAIKELLYDDNEISRLIEIAQGHQKRSAFLFILFIDDIKSNLEDCEAELSDIIEQINAVYQDDFKVWYVYLKQLEEHYLANGQIDLELTNLLIHHADNLSQFLLSLRDEANNLLSQID